MILFLNQVLKKIPEINDDFLMVKHIEVLYKEKIKIFYLLRIRFK